MNKNYLIIGILLVVAIYSFNKLMEKNKNVSTILDEEIVSLSKQNGTSKSNGLKTIAINKLEMKLEKSPKNIKQKTVNKKHDVDDLSVNSEMKSNKYGYTLEEEAFFKSYKNAGFKRKARDQFHMDSVFEREKDPLWSLDAEQNLSEVFSSFSEKIVFSDKINTILCSDVMCFVGLDSFPKLPKFELRKLIIRDAGFPSYRTIKSPKWAKGIYILRYDQRFSPD